MHRLASFRLPGLIFVTLLIVVFATGTEARAAPSVSEVRLALYQQQGGLLADLCDETSSDPAHPAHCSLCHLVAGSTVPDTSLPLVEIERNLVDAVGRLLRLHPMSGCMPDNPRRHQPAAGEAGGTGHGPSHLLHHRRSRTRHAGPVCFVAIGVAGADLPKGLTLSIGSCPANFAEPTPKTGLG